MIIPLLLAAVFLSVAMAFAWRVQRVTGNSGWIDTIWSFAVGAAGLVLALLPMAGDGGLSARQLLVAGLIGLWSARLGGYIAFRSKGASEDPRYAWLMQEWGADASRRLFIFLQVQALAGLVLVLAVALAARNPAPNLRLLDGLGVLLFIFAIGGATVADEQLRRFKADPAHRGMVCDTGLWAHSRHPNYFFEWLGWLAYPIIALGVDHPAGLLAFAAPGLMYLLLVHASGIPPLEAHMARSRGAAFAAYRERVNAFFPGPARAAPPRHRS